MGVLVLVAVVLELEKDDRMRCQKLRLFSSLAVFASLEIAISLPA